MPSSGSPARAVALAAAALLASCSCDGDSPACGGDGDCPAGRVCVAGACAAPAPPPCGGCAPGTECVDGACLALGCDYGACASGLYCVGGSCLPPSCARLECPAGEACAAGACRPTECSGRACGGDVCVDGSCQQASCVGVTCPADQACARGACYPASCAAPCAPGEVCDDGRCVDPRCVGVTCSPGELCARGGCASAACEGRPCAPSEVCVDGGCVLASCAGLECPAGETCAAGGLCRAALPECLPEAVGTQCAFDAGGGCLVPGTTVCGEAGIECGPAGPPPPEACDGIDNDCNGSIDEVCPPDAPVWASPPNGHATGSVWAADGAALRPVFRWAPAPRAETYELELSSACTTPGFSACAFDDPDRLSATTAGPTWSPTLDINVLPVPPVGVRWFWRLRACSGAGCSAWIAVRYLDVGRLHDDADGDGYSDLLAGAPGSDVVAAEGGVAVLARGGPSGLDQASLVHVPSPDPLPGAAYGWATWLGDVDADGFADAAVSDGGFPAATFPPRLFVLRGGPGGLTPWVTIPLPAGAEGLAATVATAAGDLDGDGYADLAIAAPAPAQAGPAGEVHVHLGGAAGPTVAPGKVLVNPDVAPADSHHGWPLLGGRDLDGDGFADLVVATVRPPQFTELLVYHGGEPLFDLPPTKLAKPDAPGGEFGASLAAGDLDGDGRVDLAVGAPGWDGGTGPVGAVFLYRGADGPSSPGRRLDAPATAAGDGFGRVLHGPGDVDGDGLEDLLVGAPANGGGLGAIFWFGGAAPDPLLRFSATGPTAGLAALGTSIATGDFDGDGHRDVAAGAPGFGPVLANEGTVIIYPADAGGVGPPSVFLTLPASEADARLGSSVAAAP